MTGAPPSQMRQDLSGVWDLTPSRDEQWRFLKLHTERQQPTGAFARTRWTTAQVPGSVHADLLRAGQIPDFRQGLGSLAAEWITARQWVYRRTFRTDFPVGGRRWLCLEGVDWAASVYLDGELLGRVEGAHTAARLPLPELADREHLLVIVLDTPPAEAGQLGRTSRTQSLKARYGYWWDFCTRLVQVGLWQPVSLEWDAGAALLDVAPIITLSPDLSCAQVGVDLHHDGAEGLLLSATLIGPGGQRETLTGRITGGASDLKFEVPSPQLWWPRGLGNQPLYSLSVELPGGPAVTCRFGLRDVQLVHNPASAARGALPYTLQINGKAIYARGYNVLPVEMTAGMPFEAERQHALIELAVHAHANLLRFNGVAPIAPKAVLDACDEAGMLVWQELPLTSSSTDNIPPDLEHFRAVLDAGLPPLLRRLRPHPSVVLLDAGNELTDAQRRPVTLEQPTTAYIHDHIRQAGLTQPFLPTSPSGPCYDLDEQANPDDLHDVHGPWHYRGAVDSYRPYAHSRALFHSEFGCQSPARERTLRRYLPGSPLWPMDDSLPEIVHHGEWWLMRHRAEEVFGPLPDLRTYLLLAQAVQGDVLRHALGWNRSRHGECSGALVWQLNEPWPNAHNTSLLDYDLSPKLAYYRCREANAPFALHWGLEAPVARAVLTLRPQVLADTPGRGRIELEAFDLRGAPIWRCANEVIWPASAQETDFELPQEPALLRGRIYSGDGTCLAVSEVWVARDEPQPFRMLSALPSTQLSGTVEGGTLTLTNTGRVAAPWISLEAAQDGLELFEDNGFTLLPGESRALRVRLQLPSGSDAAFVLNVQAVNVTPFSLQVTP